MSRVPFANLSFAFLAALLGTAFLLGSTTPAAGQSEADSCVLADQRQAGETLSVRVSLQAKGKLLRAADDQAADNQAAEVPMAVRTQLAYREALIGDAGGTLQSQRLYSLAEANLQASQHSESNVLAVQHRAVRAVLRDGTTQLFAEQGQLSRAELDVISLPGNSLAVYKLLPGRQVRIGEQWDHRAEDLAALLNLDHVGVNETKSQLDDIQRGLARMRLTGMVKGSVDGVATDMRVTGDYRFDTILKRISWLQLNIEEHREAGLLNPEFAVNAELRMLIEPSQEQLSAKPAVRPTADRLLLQFADESIGLRLLYPRRWRIVDDRPRHLTLRLTAGDKNVAQCSISRLADLPAGRQLGLEEFQSDIQKTMGKQFVEFEDARRETREDGIHVCRVIVRGAVSSVPVRWIYLHLANDDGRRASMVFTMDGEMAEQFATDDAVLADSLELFEPITTSPDPAPSESSTTNETASQSARSRLR